MTHDIKLNLGTDLNFKIVEVTSPEAVTKTVWSSKGNKFVDIERTFARGFVDVTTTEEGEHVVEVDGERFYHTVTFDATEVETPNGTLTMLWSVYSFTDKPEDDLDLEEVGSFEIPDPIIDMLL